MANKYIESRTKRNGVFEITLNSWGDYIEYIRIVAIDRRTLIYRGHTDSRWELIPSYFRSNPSQKLKELNKHLNQFKMASRGRCKLNHKENDEIWWAIGQHNNLKTPLLDWTYSPFVALFFAYADKAENILNHEDLKFRSIFIMDRSKVDIKCKTLMKQAWKNEELLMFVEPFTHDNQRIVNQSGLFTLTPKGWIGERISLEGWISDAFEGTPDKKALIKVNLPNNDREVCLRYLNRMNINYLSLFPDLEGSSRHCNLKRDIYRY